MPALGCARDMVAQLAVSKKLVTHCELARAHALRAMMQLVMIGAERKPKDSDEHQQAWRDLQRLRWPFARATRRLARASIQRQHDEMDIRAGLQRNLLASMTEEESAIECLSVYQSHIETLLKTFNFSDVINQCVNLFVSSPQEEGLSQRIRNQFSANHPIDWLDEGCLARTLKWACEADQFDRRLQQALGSMDRMINCLRTDLSVPESLLEAEQHAVMALEQAVVQADLQVAAHLASPPCLHVDPILESCIESEAWDALQVAIQKFNESMNEHIRAEAKACQSRWHELKIQARQDARMPDTYALDVITQQRQEREHAACQARKKASRHRKALLTNLEHLHATSDHRTIQSMIDQVAMSNVNNHIYHLGHPIDEQATLLRQRHRLSQEALDRLQTWYVHSVMNERWQRLLQWLCCLFPALATMLTLMAFWPAGIALTAIWGGLLGLLGVGVALACIECRYALFMRYGVGALVFTSMLFAIALSFMLVPTVPAVLAAAGMSVLLWKVLAAFAFAFYVPALRALYQTIRTAGPMRRMGKGGMVFAKLIGCAVFMMPAMVFAMPGAVVAFATVLTSIGFPLMGASAYLEALLLGALLTWLIIAAVQGVGVGFMAMADPLSDRGMDRLAAVVQGVGEALAAFGPTVWGAWVVQVMAHSAKVVVGLSTMLVSAFVWGEWRAVEAHRHDHAEVPELERFQVSENASNEEEVADIVDGRSPFLAIDQVMSSSAS